MECEKIYKAETRELRPLIRTAFPLQYVIRARFRQKTLSCAAPQNIVLNDIAFYMNNGKLDFMYIVTKDGLQYLMNSAFETVSEGYTEIMQLHNKNPYTPGYLAGRTIPESKLEQLCWGILDQNGKPLIPCRYISIQPIIGKSTKIYDFDYISGFSHYQNDLLFFSCKDYFNFNTVDIYAPDGTPVFRNIADLRPAEEKTVYRYSYYSDPYTQIKTMEKFHTECVLPKTNSDEDDYLEDYSRYLYDILITDNCADISYIGPAPEWLDWFLLTYDLSEVPPAPQPLLSQIHMETPKKTFADNTEAIVDFMCSLFNDPAVYSYMDPSEITHLLEFRSVLDHTVFDLFDDDATQSLYNKVNDIYNNLLTIAKKANIPTDSIF